MSKQSPLAALFIREFLPMAIIVGLALVAQRLTHHLLTGTK